MSNKEIKALNVLRTLGGYTLLMGWQRNKIIDELLRAFIMPSADDDTPKAQKRRALVAGYRVDQLSRESTPYLNIEPFITMVSLGVSFDRLLEYCLSVQIHPFKKLPEKINGLSVSCYGNWIGGLKAPSLPIQENLDNFFREHLGARHNVFVPTSDYMLIKLGYLTDRHKSRMEKNNWGGDRNSVGGDPTLRLTNLAASFPLFRYTKKSVRTGFFGETEYVISLTPSKNERNKESSPMARYIKRCWHFGVARWEMLQQARKMVRHVEIVNRFKSHIQQQEIW